MTPPKIIPEAEAAAELKLTVPTLQGWRSRRRGPAWLKIGRKIFYTRVDLDRWLSTQRHSPEALRRRERRATA